jgi:hypothetical protein
MDLEYRHLKMEINTKDNIRMVNFMVKESIDGQMGTFIKASLLWD